MRMKEGRKSESKKWFLLGKEWVLRKRTGHRSESVQLYSHGEKWRCCVSSRAISWKVEEILTWRGLEGLEKGESR